MQKVIQRTATARKQAQKKLYRAKKEEKLLERKDNIRTRKEYGKALIDTAKAARQARWEDWAKGPLAPKRDSGLQAATFGALDPAVMHPPKIPKHQRRRHILFAPGDRVCIIKGRDKGRISDIEQVNEETETVLIKNLNVVCAWHGCRQFLPNKGSQLTNNLFAGRRQRSPVGQGLDGRQSRHHAPEFACADRQHPPCHRDV